MTLTVIGQATGTIGVDGDSDWFKVTLTAGNQYVFNFAPGSLNNGQLALYDASGNLVNTSSNATATIGSSVVFEPTATGTYYVAASGQPGATGSYTIYETTSPFDFAGTTATAGTLSVGGAATGTLATSGQSDWFKVTLTAGTGYSFNLSGALGAGQVTLYDSTGKYIVSGNDGNTINGTSAFYVPTVTGTYYVSASDSNGGTGTFSVSASTATYDYAGNTGTAGTVAVGGTVTGSISNVGQSDWFKVSLTAGKEYVFDLTGTGLVPSVSVYDANGNVISTGYSGGANGGALVSFEPTASGTYYIGAAGIASSTGTFSLATSTATPDVLGTTATSGTIAIGGTASANITTQGQNDWFKVTLSAGGHYALTASGGTLSGATVSLYDANGNLLTSGSGAAFYEPTAAGTYYVGASGSGTGTTTVGISSASVDFLGTTATTGSVAAGGSVSGNIANAGQSDWFKISLTSGKEYSFSVSGALSGAEVSLYDSNGNLVAGGVGTGTAFTPSANGTYYVGASSSSGSTGTFTITTGLASDDFSSNTSTTGTFAATESVAAAVSAFSAGTLAANTQIVDSGANVQAGLDALAPAVASGKIASIELADNNPTITVTTSQLISDAAVLQDISSYYTLNVSGYSAAVSAFVKGQHDRYIPGTSHSGMNQVIEISSTAAGTAPIALGSGYNAVIIDGDHSASAGSASAHNYTFNVDANGTVNLLDTNTGQSQSLTGVTYLIFDGANANSDGSYQSIYFVGSSINGEVTSLYNAAFLRQPDLAGLEYYVTPISAGSLSLHQTALNFLASPEFLHDYPAAAQPADHGGVNDTAFINTLYTNVLNRTAGTAEVAYYDAELAAGTVDRATLLLDFAISPENQQAVSGFLVNTTNGAYADASDPLPASTVLGEAAAGATLNPDAISSTSIGTGVTINGITMKADGSITLTAIAPAVVLDLTATHNTVTVQNSGATVVDGSFNSTITLTGADSTTLGLGHGGQDTVNLLGGTNTIINNFVAGSGTTLNVTNTADPTAVQIIDGTAAKIAGSSLTFGAGTSYVINIGTVTDTSATGIAAAANKAYGAADVAHEFITFLAKDAAGDTLVWFWGSTSGAANGTIPAASLAASADTNANHLVDAAELVHVATIMGVAPSSLTAADLA